MDKGMSRRARVRKILRIVTLTMVTLLVTLMVCGFVFVNILAAYLQKNILPAAQVNLENYALDRTSYLYYYNEKGDLQVLQQLYSATDRQWASFEELPEDLIHAAIAIEDKRFYEHQGVDWITTAKAFVNMFTGSSATFGGSTLTQQLMKNLFLSTDETADDVTVQRKVIEIFRALAFEKAYDKNVVLEWYLNSIYFGNGCYGVKSAARYYFGKDLQELTTAECAALIGITNNPTLYNPYRTSLDNYRGQQLNGKQRNRLRQESVLEQMYVQGWIEKETYDAAMAQEMVFTRGNTAQENKSVYSWYVDTVLEDVAHALAVQDGITAWNSAIRSQYISLISRAGYHIYTPYRAEAQLAVDKIYTDLEQIPDVKGGKQLQSAIVIVDNRSGDVVAMAGGVGKKKDFDAYNRADVPLQIGSSVKPLTVYGPAFDKGLITPATIVDDLPMTILPDGTPFPRNDNRLYQGSRTVLRGVVSSVNAVAVNTLRQLGLKYSYDFATNSLGFTTLTDHYVTSSGSVLSDVDYAPLGLGALTKGMTVREVTSAYAAFANDGVWREGRTFLLVLDDKGEVVLDNRQESRQVFSKKAVNYMNYCLDAAVDRGTGTAADMEKELGMAVAGKTGTTSSNRDRYFAGFTGYYTAAVWCGFDTPESIELVGNTSNPAARLWKKVMLQLHKGLPSIELYDSKKMVEVPICLDSGKHATDSCYLDIRTGDGLHRVERVLVYPEDKPTDYCDKHITLDYCVEGHGVANAYCKKFAEAGALKLERKALLKLTQSRLDTLLKAEGKGLVSEYLRNDYIYLVDAKGNDKAFFGVHGTINKGLKVPYQICQVHTRKSWEDYLASTVPPTEPATMPSATRPVETKPATPTTVSTAPTTTAVPKPEPTVAPEPSSTVATEPSTTTTAEPSSTAATEPPPTASTESTENTELLRR